jgi:hypothetical protein
MIPRRRDLFRDFLAQARRDVVICYGMRYQAIFQDLFPLVDWTASDAFVVGNEDATRFVIARHFSRFFNSERQLAELAAVALRKS